MKYDFGSVTRRSFVAAAALGLAGCASSSDDSGSTSGSASEESSSSTDSDTSVLNINMASEPEYLDPALNTTVDGCCLGVNSFAGLYTYDEDANIIPAIATDEPTISDDGLTYSITLNESLWSDGTDVTANDFIYAWNRLVADETAANYAYLLDSVARNEEGTLDVTADDDYSITINLASPCPYLLSLLAFFPLYPVPQESVEDADPDGTNPGAWCQEAGFISNGAYTLESWSHDESMVYVKNENFYDADNVTMSELDFMLSADDTAIYAAYQSGDLDFADTVPTDEIPTAKETADFHVVDELGTYFAVFNVNADLFSGMTAEQACDFRHAICLLIDRQYIVDNVAQCDQVIAETFLPAGMSDGNGNVFETEETAYYDASEEALADNQAEAKELLEGCGYTFTDNGDGTYTCDPSISLPYIINESSSHQAIAECMQQDLAVLGIDMTIETQDWNVFIESRSNGNYTFARDGWVASYDDPICLLEIWASDTDNNDAQLGKEPDLDYAPEWEAFDELLDEIKAEADLEHRAELLREAEDMLMATWAIVPIYYYNDVYLQKENIDGIFSNAFGTKFFMYSTKS